MEILTKEETLKAIKEATEPLVKKIDRLYKIVPGNVNHKAACEFLEIGDNVLRRERDKPGTLIRYAMVGTKPVYDFASLIEYADSKYIPVKLAS